jgi:hypothetical protein
MCAAGQWSGCGCEPGRHDARSTPANWRSPRRSRERDERDGRVQHITLTGEGRALYERPRQAARRSQDTLLEVLDDADRVTPHDLLSRVLAGHEDRQG